MSDVRSSQEGEHPPRQRLHPLSPALHGIKALWIVIAAISWQGFARFGVTVGGMIVAGGGVLALIWATLSWYYTGYQIQGRELRINEGVLVRRHRTIPLERLQSVEVRQPLLARLIGLAELRCEVIGAAKTEAPLAYLTLDEAGLLRERLLALSKHAEIAEADDDHADGVEDTDDQSEAPPRSTGAASREPDFAPVLVVPARQLVVSQLLTPQVFMVPVAVAATIALFVWQPDMSFFGLAGLVTAAAGILLKPVRQAMADYDFRLHNTADGLRIRHGLTERRTQTLPLARVTAVMIRRPFLWRRLGWVESRVANAGRAGQGLHELASGGTLLPVGTPAQAREVSKLALSGVDMTEVELSGTVKRARWCAPFGQPALAAALTPQLFVCRKGRITPKVVAVPRERIQSVRVVQGRIQRVLGLATVHVDFAGGLGLVASAEHREVAEALHMAAQLRPVD